MAVAVDLKNGYRTTIANRYLSAARVNGPNPYVSATGQPVVGKQFNMNRFDQIFGGVSESGTYAVLGKVGTEAPTTADLIWIVVATGVPVANGVDLSAEFVSVAALGA